MTASSREPNALRLDTHYFAFRATGSPPINTVLSAVAWAINSTHPSPAWNQHTGAPPLHSGASPAEWIQRAADTAAAMMGELHLIETRAEIQNRELLRVQRELEALSRRFLTMQTAGNALYRVVAGEAPGRDMVPAMNAWNAVAGPLHATPRTQGDGA